MILAKTKAGCWAHFDRKVGCRGTRCRAHGMQWMDTCVLQKLWWMVTRCQWRLVRRRSNPASTFTRTFSGLDRFTYTTLSLRAGEEPAELFRVHPRPADSARQYNFTQFAIGLNQRPGPAKRDGGVIGRPAPTDTTLRPDVRAMEEGNMTLAADEKLRLEVKQRAARKRRKDVGQQGKFRTMHCVSLHASI